MTDENSKKNGERAEHEYQRTIARMKLFDARVNAGRNFHEGKLTVAEFRTVLRDLGISTIEIEMEVAFNDPANKEWIDLGSSGHSQPEIASPEESRAELEAWQKHRERQRRRPEPTDPKS